MDGHSETIQIEYDPAQVSYQQLLEIFWDSHRPTMQPSSRQYMSIVFYHNEEQRELAAASKQHQETKLGREIVTEIIPFSEFFVAEDYHQKYYLRQEPDLFREFHAMYPAIENLISSTAVARVNGCVGGCGTLDSLAEQLSSLGLSEAGKRGLLEIANRRLVPGCVVR